MKGAELEQLKRTDEILRLRTEENMTYRQIAQRVGISHVMVGRVLNAEINATEENIRERKSQLVELLERAISVAYEKYLRTQLPSDAHALAKLVESYKSLLGLNGPQTHQHHVAYSPRMKDIIDSVVVDAPQPMHVVEDQDATNER
ncbi:hypothetical protein C1A38_06735 [Verrucosispora sp. ts21]|uniref:helix-turn-helix domain-containing protein n=1 Tax=Verrucosispora sp. ts21 TaxID=2069341 RepID=UPI000C87E340|nr:helix-turn-helix domain-containing protein [Verrucosispora sp. ts21]PMR61784.1 hypothetical protein C1A38_06735 [Verrucosispora sp. ts21]